MDYLEAWRHNLIGHIATKPNPRFPDLGAGTGLWSIAFAEWFQAEVIAIDPAAEMLQRARRERSYPKTAQVIGRVTPGTKNGWRHSRPGWGAVTRWSRETGCRMITDSSSSV